MPARIDHLVVVAASLGEGAAWCEATLGVTPGPGGEHPLMGTHNRLLRIATVDHPRAYLEIIAIDPAAAPQGGRRRWFDMDDEAMRSTIRREGPRLVHFVASVADVAAATKELKALDIERGEVVPASRMTARGLLEWKITVRGDGHRTFDGCLPTLIEWGARHPAPALPECGVTLHSLAVTHPQAPKLAAAYEAIGLHAATVAPGAANLCATLFTPRGRVQLESRGL
ncbi:VOC family protein [Ramlibacter sp.]|uniref:VOC family protein n=1 Tax=Ramlibacter sp. TaxID=1917967 RepID=UPI003D152A49